MTVTGLASGTVYPALRRLEDSGFVASKWERASVAQAAQRPPRKYYEVTKTGRTALVAGALLFSRSLAKILTLDMGFRDEGVVNATATFQRLKLPPERVPAFKDELLGRIRAIPGVESAALTHIIPLRDWGGGSTWIDGTAREPKSTRLSRVGPGYFETLQVPLLGGRDFDARDRVGAPLVAIVNQAFARRFLNGANPLGQRLWIEAAPGSPDTLYEIVGLVGDTKYQDCAKSFARSFTMPRRRMKAPVRARSS